MKLNDFHTFCEKNDITGRYLIDLLTLSSFSVIV